MRTIIFFAALLAALLAACSKAETPVDTTQAVAPTPAPAALTAADISGTWNGSSRMAGSDSVANRWVVKSTSDSTGTLTYEGTKTPIAFTSRLDADSVMMSSATFTMPGAKKGAAKVMFKSTGRVQDGRLVGTSVIMLADKPDSVVARRTFEATRAP